jgi:hypothetical protein
MAATAQSFHMLHFDELSERRGMTSDAHRDRRYVHPSGQA